MAAGSICVMISRKESVTNLTGTLSFSSSRGDVGVGGEINKTMKSYRIGHGHWRSYQALKGHRKPTFTSTPAA